MIVMDIKESLKFIGGNIKKLEQQVYDFENIVLPRAEEDKKILKKLREDYIKLDALLQKQEDAIASKDPSKMPTAEEVDAALPRSLR